MVAMRRLAPLKEGCPRGQRAPAGNRMAAAMRHQRSNRCPSATAFGCLAQLVEQSVDNAQVAGSIPAASTRIGSLAHIGRAVVSKTTGWGFDSLASRQTWKCAGVRLIGPVSKTVRPQGLERSNRSASAIRFLAVAQLEPCLLRTGRPWVRLLSAGPVWRCGREAEGTLLLRGRRCKNSVRWFESSHLRQHCAGSSEAEQRPYKATVEISKFSLRTRQRMPRWWNWQTHHLEGVAPAMACEFDSRPGHHTTREADGNWQTSCSQNSGISRFESEASHHRIAPLANANRHSYERQKLGPCWFDSNAGTT
jgi:hypothetical protein